MSTNKEKTSSELMAELRRKMDLKKELEDEVKTLNTQIKGITHGALPRAMKAEKIPMGTTLSTPGVGTVKLVPGVYTSVLAVNKPALNEALDELGEGAISKREVNSKTLNSWVRDRLASGEEIPEQIEMTHFDLAQFRRSAKAS